MTKYDDEFMENLDFEFLEIDDFNVDIAKASISIETYELHVLTGHPQYNTAISQTNKHVIIFLGVGKYKRRISKYASNDETIDDFEPPQIVHENLSSGTDASQDRKWYLLSGVLRSPKSWISWEIEAASYQIRVK